MKALRGSLVSPRGRAAVLSDVGERGPLIAGQRVGHVRRRRRRRSLRLARRAGVSGLVLLAVLGVAAGARWVLTAPRFAVNGVELLGLSRVAPERVLHAAGIEEGTNLWRIDPAAVVARVEAVPEIQRAEVIRRYPNRVLILVEERRPFTL